MSGRDGFLCIDKPGGVSSFSIVRTLRSRLGIKKAGHAGTLDPRAEGLLVLAFGKATRLIRYLPLEPKVYDFTIQFGSQTDTLDAEGAVVASGGELPSRDAVAAIIKEFTGVLQQVPPAYSAVKVGGVRSYALARKGVPPELQPREISVERFVLREYDDISGSAELSVTCSGGTYVRSFARDIAEKLGTLGYASAIRRTRCGIFDVAKAYSPDRVDETTLLMTPGEVLTSFPGIQVDNDIFREIRYGRDIPVETISSDTSEYCMAYSGKDLIAVLRKTEAGKFHPDLVLDVEYFHADT